MFDLQCQTGRFPRETRDHRSDCDLLPPSWPDSSVDGGMFPQPSSASLERPPQIPSRAPCGCEHWGCKPGQSPTMRTSNFTTKRTDKKRRIQLIKSYAPDWCVLISRGPAVVLICRIGSSHSIGVRLPLSTASSRVSNFYFRGFFFSLNNVHGFT